MNIYEPRIRSMKPARAGKLSLLVCTMTSTMASEKKKQCRFCLSSVDSKHATSIFSSSSSRANLFSVLGAVFNVPVAADKLLSSYACLKCVESAKTIHSKLQSLQLLARASYQSILSSRVVDHPVVTTNLCLAPSHKRAKDTSSAWSRNLTIHFEGTTSKEKTSRCRKNTFPKYRY